MRRAGVYRAATFPKRRDAQHWAETVETQAHHVAASGFAPIPKEATVGHLIDRYGEMNANDKRMNAGAGGVTITADLSFFFEIQKWGRHARNFSTLSLKIAEG